MDLLLYFTFNFFIYGFIGWILENCFSYFKTGHMQKEGFLYGPLKPMYAIAMSVLVLCSKVDNIDNYTLITFCLIIPTFVELITGLIMRIYFKKDYWDYSDLKYNYKGIICLSFSLIWTILSLIGVKYIQEYLIDTFYLSVKQYWNSFWYLFVVALVLDSMKTIKGMSIRRKATN
ncbi:putative ABC transporter permease [Clostridium sp. NSJ-6]|uniref:ABC transporter permease n=1 Tax=Clostridium hominis TaxID=2763036 RepID=A0ABR7DE94_9CLOT|nr:putative ABC transporter permease [Clostridium hominis]MBC5629731.1 putative ABC transporter permease [Clostridium hominis]